MRTTSWLTVFQEKLSHIYSSGEVREISFQILEFVTQKNRLQLLVENPTLHSEINQQITGYLTRLQRHEPIQYLLGFTHFGNLKITVSPAVLIPRPETEELVYLTFEHIKHKPDSVILDCCTGSGCIALLIKYLLPRSTVFAWDISEESLSMAQKNAQLLQLPINLLRVDLLNPKIYPETKYDVIISNPPYVPADEKDSILPHVLNFEPSLALFSPQNDPILFYRYLVALAAQTLLPGGIIALEHHHTQQQQILSLLQKNGFSNIVPLKDAFGKERFIVAFLS